MAKTPDDFVPAEYIHGVMSLNLSYRDKVALLYLRSVNDWVSTPDLIEVVLTSHNRITGNASFIQNIMKTGLVDKRGNRSVGCFYRAKR